MRRYSIILILLLFKQIGLGQTDWTLISQPGTDLFIVNDSIGFSFYNEPEGSHGYTFYFEKSTDFMNTFSTTYSISGDFGCCLLSDMFFCDQDTGFIVRVNGGENKIYRTIDGGENWEQLNTSGSFNFSMFFIRSNLGYYTFNPENPNLNFFKMYQNNTSVTLLQTERYIFKNDQSQKTKIYFANDTTGFIMCKDSLDNAVIIKTVNGGIDWNEVLNIDNLTFTDIEFSSDSVGFVAGNNGNLFKTEDSGDTWANINSNTISTLNSISFSNDTVGYIVGDAGIVIKTENSGNNWILIDFINTNNLLYVKTCISGICYINDSDGFLYSNYNTSGINQTNNLKWSVYPNPAINEINIIFPQDFSNFCCRIYNIRGEIVLKSYNEKKIDVGSLETGVYILELRINNNVYTCKIIIKRL